MADIDIQDWSYVAARDRALTRVAAVPPVQYATEPSATWGWSAPEDRRPSGVDAETFIKAEWWAVAIIAGMVAWYFAIQIGIAVVRAVTR